MGVGLQVREEKNQSQQHQQGAGDVHGQVGERDDGEDGGDPTDDAGQYRSGMGQLRDDPVSGQQDQERGDGRVDESVEEHLPEGHREVVDMGAGRMQDERAARSRHRPAVDRVHERGRVRGFKVRHVQLDRIFGVDVHAVAHGILGPVRVAAVDGGQVPDSGHRVIEDLGPEIPGEVGARGVDRVGGAYVGARSHGHDVRRLGDEQPGRSGTSTARIDINDHWDLRIEEARDDVVHRSRDPAWRVHHHQERIGLVGFRPSHGAGDVGGHDGVDVARQVGLLNVRCGRETVEGEEQSRPEANHTDSQRVAHAHGSSMAILSPACPL